MFEIMAIVMIMIIVITMMIVPICFDFASTMDVLIIYNIAIIMMTMLIAIWLSRMTDLLFD